MGQSPMMPAPRIRAEGFAFMREIYAGLGGGWECLFYQAAKGKGTKSRLRRLCLAHARQRHFLPKPQGEHPP